jgi:hypothetical protein
MRSTIVPGIRQRGLAHCSTVVAQSFLTATSESLKVSRGRGLRNRRDAASLSVQPVFFREEE